MQSDFKTLIKGCRDYDRKAQRQMVNLLVPFLLSVCRRYEGVHAAAQDLVQEALILIFNHIEDCQPEEKPFMGWSKRITVNVCLEKFRKKKIPLEFLESHDITNSLAPEVLDQLGVEDILLTINTLPENQRLVFNLFVIDGYTHNEIGEMLQIKESNARTLLTRARATLQNLLTVQEILGHES
ncbi:MAG: RNA polymerase sigma factor [Saprospiraceae bacterium]